MPNLIIEIGNTAVKACWSDGVTIGKTVRYQGEKISDFILSLTEKSKPEVMVISSVYNISSRDEHSFGNECGKLVILDRNHTKLLKEKNLPEELTYDRAASIIAARYLFAGRGCTVIDFGTTLTADFISDKGEYEGGNISLGLRTRFKALNRYSRALPLLNSEENVPELGKTTRTAIQSGVVSGIMFEIDGYASLKSGNIIVFTGGDANYFAKRMKYSIFVVSNIVLIGLALIADENVKKNI